MDPIYVTGHRNPDTDSIVAAMAYAALKNKKAESKNQILELEKTIKQKMDQHRSDTRELSSIHNEEGEEKLHLLMVDPHIPAGAKLY